MSALLHTESGVPVDMRDCSITLRVSRECHFSLDEFGPLAVVSIFRNDLSVAPAVSEEITGADAIALLTNINEAVTAARAKRAAAVA